MQERPRPEESRRLSSTNRSAPSGWIFPQPIWRMEEAIPPSAVAGTPYGEGQMKNPDGEK